VGDARAGERSWASCAVCHRPDGAGRPDGTFPQLAGQHRSVIVKQLVDIRDGRRRNPVMEPFAQALVDDREIADIAAYVASLPLPATAGRGDGGDLERGSRLYARDCAACHGDRGEGSEVAFVPVLAGQHYLYLLRQLRTIAAARRANAHPDMPARVSQYTDAELQSVVDYASRLPGPARGDER
jgi:cytochrome c553